nr:hypothetical protein [Tanacetum cinerariifolium]GFA48350.1 hypothetical protein [Tanacetum cinerariifolium]
QMVLRFCWGSSGGGRTSLSKGFLSEKGEEKGVFAVGGKRCRCYSSLNREGDRVKVWHIYKFGP